LFTITDLSAQEINTVLSTLGRLPHDDVVNLLAKIRSQALAQQEEQTAAEREIVRQSIREELAAEAKAEKETSDDAPSVEDELPPPPE